MTPWTAACQASLSITNSQFTQTQLHWVGDAIQPSHPLLLPSPAFNLSQHQGLLNESALCIRWTKYWSFSFNISPSNEHPGLISLRMDWVNLFAVQGTLKSLLQHHSSKASILHHSAFLIVQLSQPYMTTGKTIALTRPTFVDKVMSLLFNMLSRLVITFLPRSKRLLISWLQSPSALILEPKKIKSDTVSTLFTAYSGGYEFLSQSRPGCMPSCVTLVGLASLREPQVPHLYKGGDDSTFLTVVSIQFLTQHHVHSRHLIRLISALVFVTTAFPAVIGGKEGKDGRGQHLGVPWAPVTCEYVYVHSVMSNSLWPHEV